MDCTERAREPSLELLFESLLPLPVLLVLLAESELEDGLRERDRGPGDGAARLGECAALGVCPALLCGDGCRDCDECDDRLRRW